MPTYQYCHVFVWELLIHRTDDEIECFLDTSMKVYDRLSMPSWH